ncbi:MAG: hypothetical protein QMC80_04110 [Thermoplasmatales archaeon]|nr:hypothetical protein [Thermoplasmatales archaeon]
MEKNITAIILGTVNGVVALLATLVLMALDVLFGLIFLIFPVLILVGVVLIGVKQYKAGAVLCGIGGAITVPIGLLGIFAGVMAWNYEKEQKEKIPYAVPYTPGPVPYNVQPPYQRPYPPYQTALYHTVSPYQPTQAPLRVEPIGYQKHITVKCHKCGSAFDVRDPKRPLKLKCPKCGTEGLLR